jgi:hypothetical protein
VAVWGGSAGEGGGGGGRGSSGEGLGRGQGSARGLERGPEGLKGGLEGLLEGSWVWAGQQLEPATLEERVAGSRLGAIWGPVRSPPAGSPGQAGLGRSSGGRQGEGLRGEFQVREDAADDCRIGDDGNEMAAALAARAREDVDGKDAAQQLRP